MTHEFIAYIDESGDDGLKVFRDIGQNGSTHWLVLSCIIVRQTNDLSLVKRRDDIRKIISPFKKKRDIHFTNLNHEQRMFYCSELAKMPLKCISVFSNKKALSEEYRKIYSKDKNRLYWFLARHLVERISWLCDENSNDNCVKSGVKIIFSNRASMAYQEFRDYLNILKKQRTQIRWNVVDIGNIQSKAHSQLAGLQFADCIASSFRNAVDPNRYGLCEDRYARLLKPIVYNKDKNFLSYGIKILPSVNEAFLAEENEFIQFYK